MWPRRRGDDTLAWCPQRPGIGRCSITSSAREQRRRDLAAEGLGGLDVDDQLDFG
jgi:hypothetical protein